MKTSREIKVLSMILAMVMLVVSVPTTVIAINRATDIAISDGVPTTDTSGLKDYAMSSNEKRAYAPLRPDGE